MIAEPYTQIVGSPKIFLDEGSTMNLTCLVKESPEPPQFIFWYHNKEPISYSSIRGGVSQITEKGEVTVSFLLIQEARLVDSGQYACHAFLGSSQYFCHSKKGEFRNEYMCAEERNGKIEMYACHGGAGQRWDYDPASGQLKHRESGVCLSAPADQPANMASGQELVAAGCIESDTKQSWQFDHHNKQPGAVIHS